MFVGNAKMDERGRVLIPLDAREKLGFEKIYISKYNLKGLNNQKSGIEIIPVGRVEEVYQYLF